MIKLLYEIFFFVISWLNIGVEIYLIINLSILYKKILNIEFLYI